MKLLKDLLEAAGVTAIVVFTVIVLLGLLSLDRSTEPTVAPSYSNSEALRLAPTFDRRIKEAKIVLGNTVVLRGTWPTESWFKGDSVAKGWCGEFSGIRYLHLKTMTGRTVGSTICK